MAFIFPPKILRESVIAALAFFDLFDYPLTLQELEYYLPGMVASQNELQEILNNDDRIRHIQDYYFLKDRAETVLLREKRATIAKDYWKKVKRFLPFIQMIPYVRMVAVCNTLAFNNPTFESDIDLFIVTKRGKLFLARVLTTLLFSILGVRRHGKKISGRFCLSFYVSEDALNLQTIQNTPHDVYFPYWMLTLQPVYGKKTFQRFIAVNTWINNYFPRRLYAEKTTFFPRNYFLMTLAKMQEFVFNLGIGLLLEKYIQKMQMKRHQKNLKNLGPEASVIVNENMLKFHNIDRRNEFTKRFVTICEKFNG